MYNDPNVSEEHMLYLDKLDKYYETYGCEEHMIYFYYWNLYDIYSSYNKSFSIELNLVKWIDLTIESMLSYIEFNDNELKLDALYYIKQVEDIINDIDDQNWLKKRIQPLLNIWEDILKNYKIN